MKKIASFMFKMTKGYRWKYLLILILILIVVLSSLTVEYLIKIAVDLLSKNTLDLLDPEYAKKSLGLFGVFILNMFGGAEFIINNKWMVGVMALIFGLINVGALILRYRIRAKVESGIFADTMNRLFHHIERLPYSYLKTHRNGDILQTCMRDERVLRVFITKEIFILIYTIIVIIFSFVFLINLNWKISLLIFSIVPIMLIYSLILIRIVKKRYRLADDADGVVTDKMDENLNSIRVVKAYNNENHEIKKFDESLEKYSKKFLSWKRLHFFFIASTDIFIFGEIIAVLLYSMSLVLSKEITAGTMVLAVSITAYVVWPIRNSAQVLGNVARAAVSVDRMCEIFDVNVENIESGFYPDIKGNIEFKNAVFQYDDGNKPVLNNISFSVKEGETIAIMGKTGSGKSTLSLILSRLIDYQGGSVKIDGFELKDISKQHIRRNIALVLQDPFLFSRTVIDNIKMAHPDASIEDVYDATKTACIHNSITRFQKGYETLVGEKGQSLSGGQRQRLAMARTILNDSPILIFDDSLSAVDAETDVKIRTALKNRNKKSTTFIITQRTMTAKDADKIIVLENGEIKEMGSHNDLIKNKGFYKKIYDMQSRDA